MASAPAIRFCAFLALLTAVSSADTLAVYHTTGINGGPPTHTLYVYDGGFVELYVDSFARVDTIRDTLDAAELQALIDLFTDNGFDQIDTMQYSGCLSCPEFYLVYDGRRVQGNTFVGDTALATILGSLNDLVSLLLQPVQSTAGGRSARAGMAAAPAAIRLRGGAGRAVRYVVVPGGTGLRMVFELTGRIP
jgi:hypothetical protein